jgi:outer membrane protein
MKKYAVILAAVALTPLHAVAQDQSSRSHDGWGFSVGTGFIVSPSYIGDDDYQISVVPNIRVTYEDTFFASVQEGAGYNVVNGEHWRVGPVVRYDFGRDDDGSNTFSVSDDTNDLRGLGDVDGTVELGAFMKYNMKPFSAKLELLQGLGGHEGLVGEASLEYSGRAHIMQQPIMYSFGPDIKFADSNYHNAYFGVDANQATASGLAQYDADAGILSYGLSGAVIVPVTDNVSTILFANYSKLGEQSAESSLVEQRGSEDQGSLGLFVNYSF